MQRESEPAPPGVDRDSDRLERLFARVATRFSLAVPTWSALAALGRSRLARSSYFWMIAVPIVARALEPFDHPIRIGPIEIAPQLPFSWELFFYMSLLVALATLVFTVFCPRVISGHAAFPDYRKQGLGWDHLRRSLAHTIVSRPGDFSDQMVEGIVRTIALLAEPSSTPTEPTQHPPAPVQPAVQRFASIQRLKTLAVPESRLADAFWYVRENLERTAPGWRALCTILYALGFLLAAIVTAQSVLYVWSVGDLRNLF